MDSTLSPLLYHKVNGHFSRQTGYGVFTVSQSQLESLKHYIENQKEHHKKHSFQEEYLALLKKHTVTYDEHYLWN